MPSATQSLQDRVGGRAGRRRKRSGWGGPASHDPRPPWPSALSLPPDDLASKANILIEPLELQAATMDDLDEDQEPAPAPAQVPPAAALRVGVTGAPLSVAAPWLRVEPHPCLPGPGTPS